MLAGCSAPSKESVQPSRDARADATAYYAAHPNFFHFATPAELPQGLDWQTGEAVKPLGDPQAIRGGVFHDFIVDFPRTLRVVGPDANGGARQIILDNLALSLLGFDPNSLDPFPALAESWAVSPDKRTYYFRLDPDARFSNGEQITADNYFFAFYFFLSPYINDPWSNNFYSTEFSSITRYDDLTIAITLPRARADSLEKAAGLRPLPIEFYKDFGPDFVSRYQWKFEPTTGAYELRQADIRKGRSITMRRIANWWANNKKFWRYHFNPDAVEYKVVRDPNKVYELFLAGQLDWYGLALPEYWYDRAPQAAEIQKGYIRRVVFYNDLPQPTYGVYLNTSDPLLSDVNVRRGIAHSLNYDEVIAQFFRSDYERMRTYAEGYGEYTHSDLRGYDFNLAKAATDFATAGFSARGADGVLTRADGTRLSINLTAAEGPINGTLLILKNEALKAGVEINLDILDSTTAFKKISEKKHQAAFLGFDTTAERFPRYWEMFHSINAIPQTNNLCNLRDPELDAMIDRYDDATDEAELKDLSWRIQARLETDAAYLPAFMKPWYRLGYWRYIQFPAYFDTKTSRSPFESGLYWIDPTLKAQTLSAMKSGETFDDSIQTFDQWKHSSK